MPINSKTSERRLLSLLFAVIILLVSLYFFGSFVRPSFSDIRDLREELDLERESLQAKQEAKTSFELLYSDFQNGANIQNLLAAALPTGEDVPQVVHQVQFLGQLASMDIRSLSVEVGRPEERIRNRTFIKQLGVMEVSFRALGSYENLKRFLDLLENNITLMDMSDVEISQISGFGNNLIYDFTIKTYFQE